MGRGPAGGQGEPHELVRPAKASQLPLTGTIEDSERNQRKGWRQSECPPHHVHGQGGTACIRAGNSIRLNPRDRYRPPLTIMSMVSSMTPLGSQLKTPVT